MWRGPVEAGSAFFSCQSRFVNSFSTRAQTSQPHLSASFGQGAEAAPPALLHALGQQGGEDAVLLEGFPHLEILAYPHDDEQRGNG